MSTFRRYVYVGPAELRGTQQTASAVAVTTPSALADWLNRRDRSELAEPFTFVVGIDGVLWLAPRRSEHVALAKGRDLLAAGEIAFAPSVLCWRVAAVSNQSTGYCPDPDSWPAVAAALDRIGLPHPDSFTDKVVFRRCPRCGQRNIVRDNDYTCAICGGALPVVWNFSSD